MPDENESNALATRIYSVVRTYVMVRTERKCGIAWERFRTNKVIDPVSGRESIDVPAPYRDARESIATNAFLRVRSCKSKEDFMEFFTGTICSVPQFLPMEQFREVTSALLDDSRWEETKALTMLALSGMSRV